MLFAKGVVRGVLVAAPWLILRFAQDDVGSWLLNGIQQLGRKRAHLEVFALQLLDLEAVEARIREEIIAQPRVLLLDDPRQQLIDVERLEPDLGDDLLEQRLSDDALQLG